MYDEERSVKIYWMRHCGLSFRAIGAELGISGQRVEQIMKKFPRDVISEIDPDPYLAPEFGTEYFIDKDYYPALLADFEVRMPRIIKRYANPRVAPPKYSNTAAY